MTPASRDRGSGTVLMLGLMIVGGFLIIVVLTLASAVLARHRAGAAADLAALAAAGSGEGGQGCARAGRVAAANRATLEGCRWFPDGSVIVAVESVGHGWPFSGRVMATARAAPGADQSPAAPGADQSPAAPGADQNGTRHPNW